MSMIWFPPDTTFQLSKLSIIEENAALLKGVIELSNLAVKIGRQLNYDLRENRSAF